MKAAVLEDIQKLVIQEVPSPQINPYQVLVKLKNCGICTLEQRLYNGDMKIYFPLVPGHETSGEIVEVGTNVISSLHPGMRVAIDLVYRCHECYYCRSGLTNLCLNRFNKNLLILGGFSEYIAVRPDQVYPIPDTLSFEEAAFTEPVACCIHSLRKIKVSCAEDVLIIGSGPMGLMHLQVANAMGARVFISDPDESRLQLAKELGAFKVLNPSKIDMKEGLKDETEGRGVDACVVTSQAHSALYSAFEAVRKSGRVNIYTSYLEPPSLPIDMNILHRNEVLVTGTEGRTEPDFQQALRLIAFEKVSVKPLISKIVGLDDLEEGIKAAISSDTLRVLLAHENSRQKR